jgi:hypothetical protein
MSGVGKGVEKGEWKLEAFPGRDCKRKMVRGMVKDLGMDRERLSLAEYH